MWINCIMYRNFVNKCGFFSKNVEFLLCVPNSLNVKRTIKDSVLNFKTKKTLFPLQTRQSLSKTCSKNNHFYRNLLTLGNGESSKHYFGRNCQVVGKGSNIKHLRRVDNLLPTLSLGCVCQKRFYCHGNEGESDSNDSSEMEGDCDEMEAEKKLQDHSQDAALRQFSNITNCGHRVFVIQPVDRNKLYDEQITSPDLQVDEAIALVHSLPDWQVVDAVIYTVKKIESTDVFGSGQMEELTADIKKTPGLTAVFVAVESLNQYQLAYLESKWNLPVFDRFTIVIQIFKAHATTAAAKLQVALAEVPYIRSRLNHIHQSTRGRGKFLGGTGLTLLQSKDSLLMKRERHLKAALEGLKKQRSLVRDNRKKRNIPTVAVVGYTNSGKTTLIKALTNDDALVPCNRLFATLDVTAHGGYLPNRMLMVYMDTVGFISYIPASLIEAFAATLEDAITADLVIHVRDISHPDCYAQKINVQQTVSRMLSPENMATMIEVCNKVDKIDELPPEAADGRQVFYTSSVTGAGLDRLRQEIQTRLIHNMGYQERKLRVPLNGEHLSWLYKEATVVSMETDTNTESLIVHTVISPGKYAKFMARFGPNRKQYGYS